jgi:Zn-finger nucleic acid-binding protein
MREMVREGVTIDTCTQCRGVWLDRGELEKLAAALAGQMAAPASAPVAAAAAPVQEPGFWQRHQVPQAAYPPQQQHYADRRDTYRRDRDDDDDDDRRRGYHHKPSKLSRLMDFFD